MTGIAHRRCACPLRCVFAALARAARRRRVAEPQPGSRGAALAADRQARAGVRAAGAARSRTALVTLARPARRALPAQRLGQLVPGVPRRASGAHALRRDQARARGRLQLEGRARRCAALAGAVRQSVLAGASPTTKARPRSTGASTARRRPSWSMRDGVDPLEARRPAHRRGHRRANCCRRSTRSTAQGKR